MTSSLPESSDASRVRADKTRVLAGVATLAAERGIRLLAVGGPVFAAQGLISPRLSRSASVIVDLAVFGDFVAALIDAGWTSFPASKRPSVMPAIVLVMSNPEWVVRLDIYTVFPGFYIDPKRAFAILWARRQVLTLHDTRIFMLDRLSMVMMAVHDRLGTQSWKTSEHNYDRYLIDQFRLALTPKERQELLELVRALGATEPMRPLLDALELDAGEVQIPTEVYVRWRLAVPSATPATRLILAIAECPPRRRFKQTIRIFRQAPGAALRGLVGSPKAWWLILTARRRMHSVHHEVFVAVGLLKP